MELGFKVLVRYFSTIYQDITACCTSSVTASNYGPGWAFIAGGRMLNFHCCWCWCWHWGWGGGALQPLSEGTSHYGRLVELTPGVHHDDGLPLVLLPVPQGVGDLESFSGKSQDWPTVVLDDLHAEVLHLHHLALVVLPPVFS